MISSVLAKNLKNSSFEFALYPKTLIVGPNGAGKTAIVQAVLLSLDGAVPGIAKKNEAILDAVGCNSGALYVETTFGNMRLGRKYEKDEKGSVKQVLMVDRRKADAKSFGAALNTVQAPVIVAVDEFLSMTSKRMVAFLAGKVGGDELEELSSKIEKAKTELSHWQGKLRESESFISKLSGNIAQLNLPSGTLAEVKGEIKTVEADLKKSKAELAELERKEWEEAEAIKKAQAQAELPLVAPTLQPGEAMTQAPPEVSPVGQRMETFPSMQTHSPSPGEPGYRPALKPSDSIQAIIDQIRSVDCPTCKGGTALMVALRELKKWRA